MQVKIKLSGNLASILTSFPKDMVMELKEPVTIGRLLFEMDMNPLIITTIIVNSQMKDREFMLTEDSEVLLIGPIAGG